MTLLSAGWSKFIAACLVLMITGMALMVVFQVRDSIRAAEAAEVLARAAADASREREDLRLRVRSLEASLAADHAAYGNRGIIQQAVLKKAIERGWFTDAEVTILLQVAKQADYPMDAK